VLITDRVRKRLQWGILAAIIAMAMAAGSIFWKASRAVDESREALESRGKMQFAAVKLDRKPAAGFEAVSAPAVFEDAAIFHGHIFICGHAGLSEFDADGNPVARFRPGFELPAAPLVRMNTGVAADAHEQELYIATAGEGLLAYDGRQMRQIRAASAPLRKLTAVLVASNGKILMGTEKDGVLAYDGKRLEPLHATLSGIPVTALAGSDSDLWIGTLDRGLLHFIAGRLESWKEADGMPDARVTSIEQANDAVYAGTPLGVAEIRNGKVARVLGQGLFAETLLARGETLYVGTLEDGTVELGLNSKVARPRRKERPALGQTVVKRLFVEGERMFELREDRLESNGLAVLKRDPSLLKDNNITALAPDADGRLWVGYFDKGLDIVDKTESRHVENDNVYCVNRIVHDRERKRTGVATANGFVLFDSTGAQRQVLTKSDGLIANHVTDALLEADGSWTLGTPAGVTFFENGHASSIFALQGLVNNHVYALGECGGRMVVGTLGGVSLLDHGLIKASFTTANSALRHNWITAVTGYPNAVTNGCFVGTYGAGVMALDRDGRWSAFSDMPKSVEVNPNAMLSTARAVYAGTLGKGLAVYDVGRERWTFVTDGLPSLNVTAVGTDGNGVLYIGTDNGLVRVGESALIH
jgi:ligand-binding sensor domain-containing protein